MGEKNKPNITGRKDVASYGTFSSTYGPTPLHNRSMEIAATEYQELKKKLDIIINQDIPKIEAALKAAGAPWIDRQPIPEY